MGVCVIENLSRVFFFEWPPYIIWVMRVYIIWVKDKKVTLKNSLGRMFCEYLAGKPYPRDTREIDSLARLFSFQLCVSHVAFLRVSFLRASRKIHLIYN